MWQQVIVAVIVAAAALHFVTKYLPAAWRRQIVYLLARRGWDQNKLARLFRTQSSCGDGCSSCGSCDTPPATSATSSASDAPPPSAPLKRVIKLHVQR
ncbi:MAG: DUF6587 family protein [Pseudomonadota bacterium]